MKLILGDCLEEMPKLEANSVDTIITDSPYGIDFMGKDWDHGVPGVAFWKAALRVAKPGAMLFCFGGDRTHHRLMTAIEDAGWEIRTCIYWIFGSGFPKSLAIGKQIDRQERNKWLKICKAIDNTGKNDIINAWINYSKHASNAVKLLQKTEIEAGELTLKNGSVHDLVVLQINPESKFVHATIAERIYLEAQAMLEEWQTIAQENVEATQRQSQESVIFAEGLPSEQNHFLLTKEQEENTAVFIALESATEFLNERTTDKLKAVEALKTWLGRKKLSNAVDTNALCAALTDDLKRIILNQSKTFQSLDTNSQMEIASATIATITEYMAAHLISFTVNTLRKKAIDKAAGAEREVVGKSENWRPAKTHGGAGFDKLGNGEAIINVTAPATPAAELWEGWGTALKPAAEIIVLAMKPLDGTFAENALKWGVAGLWIDGGRIEAQKKDDYGRSPNRADGTRSRKRGHSFGEGLAEDTGKSHSQGRWPANILHDGSDEVLAGFPQTKSGKAGVRPRDGKSNIYGGNSLLSSSTMHTGTMEFGDSGSAARFFYCAKSSKRERNQGLERMEERTAGRGTSRRCANCKNPIVGLAQDKKCTCDNRIEQHTTTKNHHPCVKPLALMRYLCKLSRTPTGGVILDPFAGSFTTGVAAVLEGRDFIGIDMKKDYVEIGKLRIEDAQNRIKSEQPALFT